MFNLYSIRVNLDLSDLCFHCESDHRAKAYRLGRNIDIFGEASFRVWKIELMRNGLITGTARDRWEGFVDFKESNLN